MKNNLKSIIKKIPSKMGYKIFNQKEWIPYLKSNDNFKLYKNGLLKSKQLQTDNFLKQLRFFSLIEIVKNVLKNKKIKNENFVECGCWRGHSTFMISNLLKKNNFKKKFYIFDSFEGGLSKIIKKDNNLIRKLSSKDKLAQKKYFKSSEEDVKNLLKGFSFVKIYKGWIPKKFKNIKTKRISFLHLDVDLYEPTLETLKFFYPRLKKGGIIVCDDYNISSFPGAKVAWDEFFSKKKNKYSFFYQVPLGGCFLIK